MAGTQEPVAVLGIGAMGHGMAASALRAGIPTIVWNRRLEAARDLAELGAEVAPIAADAARRAAIVVTMVTDADAVLSVARDQGMLAALAPGAIWAQMSTIGVAGIDRVAALAGAARPDVIFLDAPVSGSKDPAEGGQLTIFASGPAAARARVAALFGALGQRTIWLGEAGAGTRLKLVNNTWLAFATEAVATSVALARRLGLDTETVVDALGGGPLVSTWQRVTLQRLAADITQDRRALLQLMAVLGVPVRRSKLSAAWAAEKAARLKLNGSLLSRSPLSSLKELEMLRLGVEGKAAGWRTLRALADADSRLDRDTLDELMARAREQAGLLEELRVRAAAISSRLSQAEAEPGRGRWRARCVSGSR